MWGSAENELEKRILVGLGGGVCFLIVFAKA